jgi:hypothetical protein
MAARHAITRGLLTTAWALAACSNQSSSRDQASLVNSGIGATAKTVGDPAAANDGRSAHTCSGSPGGACTPTEQLFLQHDPGCYACLLKQGCVDDVTFNDKGNECGDLIGPTEAGVSREQTCLDVVACTLAHASAQPVVNSGYCGTATGLSCTHEKGPDGPCIAQEQAGAESTDPMIVLKRYTDKAFGAGMANEIFQCAISNHCMTCLH